MAKDNKTNTSAGDESKALTIDEQLAAALKKIEQLNADKVALETKVTELENKYLPGSDRAKLILTVTQKGKGFYAIGPFRDKAIAYKPGDKINPDNLTNPVADYIKKDLVYEVK
jgi:hypothetical protein